MMHSFDGLDCISFDGKYVNCSEIVLECPKCFRQFVVPLVSTNARPQYCEHYVDKNEREFVQLEYRGRRAPAGYRFLTEIEQKVRKEVYALRSIGSRMRYNQHIKGLPKPEREAQFKGFWGKLTTGILRGK